MKAIVPTKRVQRRTLWLQLPLYSLGASQLLICLNGLPSRPMPLRVAIDVFNFRVAGLLSFSQKRARKSPDRELENFYDFSYIFLYSVTPGILFFNLALGMGYQSRVLTTHDLYLIIC